MTFIFGVVGYCSIPSREVNLQLRWITAIQSSLYSVVFFNVKMVLFLWTKGRSWQVCTRFNSTQGRLYECKIVSYLRLERLLLQVCTRVNSTGSTLWMWKSSLTSDWNVCIDRSVQELPLYMQAIAGSTLWMWKSSLTSYWNVCLDGPVHCVQVLTLK